MLLFVFLFINNYEDFFEKFIVSDILFFVKNLYSQTKSTYSLISDFSEFEELGQSLQEFYIAIKKLNFVNLDLKTSFVSYKAFFEICGPSNCISSNNVIFSPNSLLILPEVILGRQVSDNLSLKVVFKVVL